MLSVCVLGIHIFITAAQEKVMLKRFILKTTNTLIKDRLSH